MLHRLLLYIRLNLYSDLTKKVPFIARVAVGPIALIDDNGERTTTISTRLSHPRDFLVS